MKAPGTAYDNELIGRDPQPGHMDGFQSAPDTEEGDWGAVHTNSGIPNKAFYLTAVNLGGNAWEAPGQIWYESLKASPADTDFQQFADTTCAKAGQLYGACGPVQQAVVAAWREVGIRVTGVALASRAAYAGAAAGEAGYPADLTSRIAAAGPELTKVSQESEAS